jgi:hypothetical protein
MTMRTQIRAEADWKGSVLAPRAVDAPAAGKGPLAYRVAFALALTGTALGVRWLLDPWLGAAAPLSLMYAVVALTSWLAGLLPALCCSSCREASWVTLRPANSSRVCFTSRRMA